MPRLSPSIGNDIVGRTELRPSAAVIDALKPEEKIVVGAERKDLRALPRGRLGRKQSADPAIVNQVARLDVAECRLGQNVCGHRIRPDSPGRRSERHGARLALH